MVVAGTRTALNAYKIFESFISKGYNNRAAYDATKEALTIGIKLLLAGEAIKGATAIAPKVEAMVTSIAPSILNTALFALVGWCYYKAGEYFMNMTWTLDRTLNSPQFWGSIYGYPNDKQDW